MIVKKAACIPLVLHDPYFSIWSRQDHLYDGDPVHWSEARQKLRGYVTVDGMSYGFLGDREFHAPVEQKEIEVTATATAYHFENEKIKLTVRFTTPLLLENLRLLSRPCTYVDFVVEKKADCSVNISFFVSSDLVSQDGSPLVGCAGSCPEKEGRASFSYASMGRAFQQPLGGSGDRVTINWGYVYLASVEGEPVYDAANRQLGVTLPLDGQKKAALILAYDDLLSINYFGQWRKAYWTKEYTDVLDAVGAAFQDKEEVCARAAALDAEIEERARKLGGDSYVYLCNMSYRHSIAAHKLIEDEDGNVIFLSKENNSNGCIGTVDVSYPSVPLYLLYNTELVKGMLRPVFKFAACDVWEYDFAPHDVGRYPYAWGQVYGLNGAHDRTGFDGSNGTVFPPYYQYPSGGSIYEFINQMPVEECGNMLLMTAAACMVDNSGEFAAPYMDVLKKWTEYLLKYGADPGNQLCTDDFAGHLSHNVNLSAKAIMGIEAYARLAAQLGREKEAGEYHEKAKEMAELIWKVKGEGDTIGGVISCVIKGCPIGLGQPVFGKLHAALGNAMLSINAVKGFAYGQGFDSMELRGSEQNDVFYNNGGRVETKTNYSGGIQGGISNGQDIYFRVAFKPVATVLMEQHTVNVNGIDTTMKAKGRHDPCVLPRAVPIVEAMAAITILDYYLIDRTTQL